MRRTTTLVGGALVTCLITMGPVRVYAQSTTQNAAARTLFLEGRDLWDDGKFADAEKKFREALTKYPKADQSDRTAYYLITTLIKLGKTVESRVQIENFKKNYPQSTWNSDVEEKRIALAGSPMTVRVKGAEVATVVRSGVASGPSHSVRIAEPILQYFPGWRADGTPAPFTFTGTPSLESEILRLIIEKDPDRGIEAAKERLKADPSDPAVIANLGLIANSSSAQAMPFLVGIAGSSTSPNAQSQAIFWISRRDGNKDGAGKALVDMLANSRDSETDTIVTEALSRLNTIGRQQAFDRVLEGKFPDRVSIFEKIYRNTANGQLRTEIAQTAGQVPDAKAVNFLADIARTDKDLSVRRAAVRALAARKDADTLKTLEDILRGIPAAEPRR